MRSEIQIHDETIEIARLTNKHPLLTTCMGEVLPGVSQVYPSITKHLTHVLDISCGPGGWMLECARRYKNAHIIGVDTRKTMVRCAANRCKAFPNIDVFHIASYTDFDRFQDAFFDIISLQCIHLSVRYDQWIHLLNECKRMLKKGGCIRFTTFEYARSNSPALQKLHEWYSQIEDRKQSFSHTRQDQGSLYELEPLLSDHFFETFLLPHLINFSYGTAIHKGWTHDLLLQAQQDLPYMAHHRIITQEQIIPFLHQMEIEFALPNFHALQYGMTIWGRKN
ncbi:class I SAM-dependent methyltransferase [Dictyobacter aurantiacus]|uniref:class I SAM-dependent methyltransferase n=1 Tax=Dictyobacter aurantiacus TaxID=1936993 RepID=UPI000F83A3EE|nr:class I SAM-dependent methyltransferase [Dictyobacter aurantiacus]